MLVRQSKTSQKKTKTHWFTVESEKEQIHIDIKQNKNGETESGS